MKTEEELAKYVQSIPHEDIDIFVSHGPPYQILDKNKYGEHCGSVYLGKVKPDYFIFGHIHEDGGKELSFNDTRYINASVIDEYMNITNKPITFKYA